VKKEIEDYKEKKDKKGTRAILVKKGIKEI
jgi:hypothetical protein